MNRFARTAHRFAKTARNPWVAASIGALISWFGWGLYVAWGVYEKQFEPEQLKAYAALLTPVAVIMGLWLGLRRTGITDQGQLTDRFAKAIELLGDLSGPDEVGSPTKHFGGIYALERIAWDSPDRDHWTVMEVLCWWVRQHPLLPQTQAILTVLGRRNRKAKTEEGQRLDLHGADLSGLDLRKAHLERADLREADLSGANLWGAHLSGADLVDAKLLEEAKLIGADLSGALLVRTDLSEAKLDEAKLNGAKLLAAKLRGADLMDADLRGADLKEADFSGANLYAAKVTSDQLRVARGNDETTLPKGVEMPANWRSPLVPIIDEAGADADKDTRVEAGERQAP